MIWILILFWILMNWYFGSAFVNNFARWSSNLQNMTSMNPSSIKSLMKWCQISICLFLLWNIGFLVMEMVLVLSQWTLIGWGISIPKYLKSLTIQMAWVQVEEETIYSSSIIEITIVGYFLVLHGTSDLKRRKHNQICSSYH